MPVDGERAPQGEAAQGARIGRYTVVPRVLCFLRDGDDLLLLRGAPGKPLWAGLYNGVGGHMEPHEDPYQAALREIREETGLEVSELHLGGILHVSLSQAPGVLVFCFVGRAPCRDVRPSREGTLEWIPVARLPELPLVEDLPQLLPRLLQPRPGHTPFFARSFYLPNGCLRIEFSER
ncbi:MAG: NUDIX domain-containing protein [Chloroflexia bacterium]